MLNRFGSLKRVQRQSLELKTTFSSHSQNFLKPRKPSENELFMNNILNLHEKARFHAKLRIFSYIDMQLGNLPIQF